MREISRVPDYAKLWPGAQFVHIVRDGRDVAASQMTEHGTWGYGSITEAAKSWATLVQRVRKLSRTHAVLEIRYEDLVLDAEPTLRRILDFLDLPWDDGVMRHADVSHSLFENPYNHPSLQTATQPINASAVGRYRRDLTPTQIDTFHAAAGDFLAELGYEVSA